MCACVFLKLTPFVQQVCVLIIFAGLFAVSFVGLFHLKEGLDLTDVVPRNTDEHKFLEKREKYFGFYNFFAVTKNIDYPSKQLLLEEYHIAFDSVPNIIRTKGNMLPRSWLQTFRDWLEGMLCFL